MIFCINKNGPELAGAMHAAIKQVRKNFPYVKFKAKHGHGDKAWLIPLEKNPPSALTAQRGYQGPERRSLPPIS